MAAQPDADPDGRAGRAAGLKAWKFRNDSTEAQTYYAVPTAKKWEYGLIYLGLAGFLAVMAYDTHALLEAQRGG